MAASKIEEWLEPSKLVILTGWARDGLQLKQIAHNMGINPATLSRWQAENEKIKKAIEKGREVVYYETENSLYKSALGYDTIERDEVQNFDSSGVLVSKSQRKHLRHIPPNLGAICFILKNMNPQKWQDKPIPVEINHTVDDGFLKALEGTAAKDWEDDGSVVTDGESDEE